MVLDMRIPESTLLLALALPLAAGSLLGGEPNPLHRTGPLFGKTGFSERRQASDIGLGDSWVAIRDALPRTQAAADALSRDEALRLLNGALRETGKQGSNHPDSMSFDAHFRYKWSFKTGEATMEYWRESGRYNLDQNGQWVYFQVHRTIRFNPTDVISIGYMANPFDSPELGNFSAIQFMSSDQYIRNIFEVTAWYGRKYPSDPWVAFTPPATTDTRSRVGIVPIMGLDNPSVKGIAFLLVRFLREAGAKNLAASLAVISTQDEKQNY